MRSVSVSRSRTPTDLVSASSKVVKLRVSGFTTSKLRAHWRKAETENERTKHCGAGIWGPSLYGGHFLSSATPGSS